MVSLSFLVAVALFILFCFPVFSQPSLSDDHEDLLISLRRALADGGLLIARATREKEISPSAAISRTELEESIKAINEAALQLSAALGDSVKIPAAVENSPPAPPMVFPRLISSCPECLFSLPNFPLGDSSSPEARQSFIRSEFLHAWSGYEKFAWGRDELKPVSRQSTGSFNMALTMVDSLDTLWIMGFHEEFGRARDFLSGNLTFGHQEDVNLFEVTIRILGGLLAAHALSKDNMWLEKARDLGDSLLIAFDSPTGLPYSTVCLGTRRRYNPAWASGASTMAEVGSIQLEFQTLSRLTGNPIYREKVDVVTRKLFSLNLSLYSQYLNIENGQLSGPQVFTLGARVDSLYEYFLKQILLNSPADQPDIRQLNEAMYLKSSREILHRLLKESSPNSFLFIAELSDNQYSGKMDHLVCFVPGMLALAVHMGVVRDEAERISHMAAAERLMETCFQFYKQTNTGLASEIYQFANFQKETKETGEVQPQTPTGPDFLVDDRAQHSLLRPETVESLFYLWRITKNQRYRDWGWEIMKALATFARIDGGGYSGLKDVRNAERPADRQAHWENHNDHMESFLMAETFKYLYLLFAEDQIMPIEQWIFNTEAHPLPRDFETGEILRVAIDQMSAGDSLEAAISQQAEIFLP